MLTVKDGPGFYRGFSIWPRRGHLQLNLVFLFVEEMKLGEVIIGIGADPDLLLVLPPPVPLFGTDAEEAPLGEIGVHNGMHYQDQVLMLVIEQVA